MQRIQGSASSLYRRTRHVSWLARAVCVLGALVLSTSQSYAQLLAPNTSSNSVTITWTAPGDDGDVGTASQYDIRYSTSSINDANWGAATEVTGEPSPQPAGSSDSFTVENLEPNTTYYFAIKSADEVPNWSPLSNIASATTDPEQEAPAEVADLQFIDSTSTSATLAWTAPGDDSTVGTASQYDIRYSTSPITEANWGSASLVSGEPAPQPAGSSESFTVTGLIPSTTYYFALKTADEVPNWSGLSNIASGATGPEESAPANIADLQAVYSTSSSIAFTWTAPGDDGNVGIASQYEMRYSTVPITEINWASATLVTGIPAPQPAGSDESFTIENLEMSTTYYIAVKTADEVPNWSALSNIASAATTGDDTPPAAINDLQAAPGGSS